MRVGPAVEEGLVDGVGLGVAVGDGAGREVGTRVGVAVGPEMAKVAGSDQVTEPEEVYRPTLKK